MTKRQRPPPLPARLRLPEEPQPRTRSPETVGDLFVQIQQALREGDDLALGRRLYRLDYALRSWNGWIRSRGIADTDLPEARQRVLLRIYATAQGHRDVDVRSPMAFVRNAAAWEIADFAKELRRHAGLPLDDEAVLLEVEESGMHERTDLLAKLEGERVLEEARAILHAYVAEYSDIAGTGAGAEVRRNHVRAWFVMRVQGRSAGEAARELGVTHLAEGGRQAVWQWAKRGRDLVVRIAASDAEPHRARVMREAAAGRPESGRALRG